MTFLTTHRLCLRNLRAEDLDTIYTYRNDPRCNAYQRWEAFTKEDISAFLLNHRKDVFLSGKEEQHYAISLHCDAAPVGELACFYNPADSCITLGITIAPGYHRRGFAFELLSEVIRQLQQKFPAFDIVGLIDNENDASIRLFQKLGFHLECYAESICSNVYVLPGQSVM